jgi:3-hydroxyisobutyrate dehydrogenase-like beta-hydroxyacid dehydrogenase
MKIAFIGLGNMGTGIAQCILKSGHDLIVWNRTATKTGPLVALGARAATTAREAAAAAHVVITSLMDDKSVLDVVHAGDGVLAGMRPEAVHATLQRSRRDARTNSKVCTAATAVSTFPLPWLGGQMLPRAGGLLRSSADRPTRWKG